MKKKIFLSSLAMVIALFCLLSPFNSAASGGEPLKLSYANFFPAQHFTNIKQFPLWIKEVEQASGGKIKITNYPGQTLLEAPEIYEGVVRGTADLGHGSAAYSRNRFLVTEASELPGIEFGSAAANSIVAWETYKKFNPAEYSDVKVMYLMAVGPGFLYTKKPVRSLEDLKGMRIRATGPGADALKAMGAVPVAMTMPEVYESLSKGIIDGQMAPPEVLKAWRQAEVTKYITVIPPIYASVQYSVMNLGKWKLLPEDVKQAIEKVNEEFVLKAGKIWDSEMRDSIDWAIKNHRMEVIRFSPEETAKCMAVLQAMKEAYIAKASAKGLPAKQILDFVIERAAVQSKLYQSPLVGY
jgi:TRAP-type C4-dicarboxylate transport system substrate-binding protein